MKIIYNCFVKCTKVQQNITKEEVFIIEKLEISQNYIKNSRTLRLPINIVKDIEVLSEHKKIPLNQVTTLLLEYALKNLDIEDKKIIENYKRGR